MAGNGDDGDNPELLVFVSYTHQDNEELADLEWVTHFHDQLEKRVRAWVGKTPKVVVWRDDTNLAGNHMLDDELARQLEGSAALVAICSPSYIDSTYCLWELDRFIASAEGTIGATVGTRSRVFRVMKSWIDLDELSDLPEPLSAQKGYEFYDRERPSEEFHPKLGDPTLRSRFYGKLRQVAWEISRLLRVAASEVGRPDPAPGRLTVYLAEPTTDVGEDYDRLYNELRFRGHELLPVRQLRGTATDVTSEATDLLGKCQVAVHLLGHRYGTRPEGTDLSIPHLQLDAAHRAASGGLTQLVALPPAQLDLHPEQVALVARLERGAYPNAEVLRVGSAAFTAHVLDRLEAAAEPEPTIPRRSGEGRLVYLLSDLSDREAAADLRAELEREGHLVDEPRDGTTAERRKHHEDLMLEADALLLYYGEATPVWVTRKLREVEKSRAWGRRQGFDSIAVYVAPPSTPDKEAPDCPGALVLPGGAEFKPGYLEPFLAELAAAAR